MQDLSLSILLVLLAGYVIGLICLFGFGFVILAQTWGLARIEWPKWLVASPARLFTLFFGSALFLLAWDLIFRVWQGD